MEKAKDLFFPNGSSKRGDYCDFDAVLGDFKQNIISPSNFVVEDYIKSNCLTTKPRLYLMTKRKLAEDYSWLDSPSLPDLLEDNNIEILSVPSSPENSIEYNPSITHDTQASMQDAQETTNVLPITGDTHTCTSTIIPPTNPNFPAISDFNPDIQSFTQDTTATTHVLPINGDTLTSTNTAATAPDVPAILDSNPEVSSQTVQVETETVEDPESEDMNKTIPYSNDHHYCQYDNSPVTLKAPRLPSCSICTDRYIDSFLGCGHVICFVCAAELQERESRCHICRNKFSKIFKLFY